MDDFTPKMLYRPEDEYEPLVFDDKPAEKADEAPAPKPEADAKPAAAPAPEQKTAPAQKFSPAQPVKNMQSARPAPQPAAPAPHPMYYHTYQQPGAYSAQPVQQGAAVQPTAYAGVPQQPVYYQAYQQPAVYAQQPIQQPMIQRPVQQPIAQPVVQQPIQPVAQQFSQPVQYTAPAAQQNAAVYAQYKPAAQVPAVQTQPVQAPVQTVPVQTAPVQTAPVQTAPASPNPYVQEQKQYSEFSQATKVEKPQKQPTSTGTKVFIIVLIALLAAMVLGFVAVLMRPSAPNGDTPSRPDRGYSIGGEDGGNNGGSGSNPIDGFDFGYQNGGTYTDVEDEIVLKADNGETQKRDDDNPASVGSPDENAKGITLNPLPADKDDAKYTTQSAYNTVSDSVVTVICYREEITDNYEDIVSQGSGTVISEDGYLLTNAHVIGNSRIYAVNIIFNNGDKYQAKIIGYDTWSDLAVLKIDATGLKPVTFGDSSKISIGDDVIAVGSPGGEKFQNSLTKGVVSAVERELSVNKYVRYIQSDAAISPGSSGGPLCNIYGQVIGITTAKTVAQNYENMSFSIPSATAESIVSDLLHYGYVKGRTRIGISGTEVGAEDVYYYDMPAGVVIGTIDENGSLAGTSIKEGDIITELDGKPITSFQDIYDVLADHEPEDKISIKVKRPTN